MILPVVQYGQAILRRPADRVRPGESDLTPLIDDMLETMTHHEGIGLAAPQIGRSIRLAVVDISNSSAEAAMWIEGEPVDSRDHMPMVLINPEIVPLDAMVEESEGCLSFPGIFGLVPRPKTIEVRTLQPDGSRLHFRCNELLARVIQHETDHLDGILYIDRMTPATLEPARADIEALHRKTTRSRIS